ncbi:hypothetical protein M153_8380002, partial [Pseudoloma neurophilia]
KKFSKGLRLKVVNCKKTLDFKWRIKDFLLDSNEYEGGTSASYSRYSSSRIASTRRMKRSFNRTMKMSRTKFSKKTLKEVDLSSPMTQTQYYTIHLYYPPERKNIEYVPVVPRCEIKCTKKDEMCFDNNQNQK